MTRYFFEDLEPGQFFELGTYTVTKAEIIEFANEFDPQPFHLDETAGKASILGGLAASGWHTASITMRLLALGFLNNSSCQGSPGVDKLVWRKPVLAGDTLAVRMEITSARLLKSRPGFGMINMALETRNQTGAVVMTYNNPAMFTLRGEAV
ncbi:MaoC family dehydratase [Roseibium algae]